MLHVDLFSVYLAVIASGLALSLVWLVVARTFPTLYAARYWFGGTLAAGVGSALSLWRGAVDPMVPIVLGNGMILIGSGLGCKVDLQHLRERGCSPEEALFGEGPGGFLISGEHAKLDSLATVGVAVLHLGTVGGETIEIAAGDRSIAVALSDAAGAWRSLAERLDAQR